MRRGVWVLLTVLIGSTCVLAENAETRDRRQRAATAFHDGILLVHAKSQLDSTADGFRQDPYFYYFSGLQNTVGALFVIDGKSGESWLFLPSKPPLAKIGLPPEVTHPERKPSSNSASNMSWTGRNLRVSWHGTPVTPLACTT